MIHQDLSDKDNWIDHLTFEMRSMADEVSVDSAILDDVEFQGGDGISFKATMVLELQGVSYDRDGEVSGGNRTFYGHASGSLTGDGFEIEDFG
jgi:hypothetical protein